MPGPSGFMIVASRSVFAEHIAVLHQRTVAQQRGELRRARSTAPVGRPAWIRSSSDTIVPTRASGYGGNNCSTRSVPTRPAPRARKTSFDMLLRRSQASAFNQATESTGFQYSIRYSGFCSERIWYSRLISALVLPRKYSLTPAV